MRPARETATPGRAPVRRQRQRLRLPAAARNHVRRLTFGLLAALAVVGVTGVGTSGAGTVIVTFDAASTVQITDNCTAEAGRSLGTVIAGSNALTDTGASVCSYGFSASSDSSMIRVGQRDGVGTAMGSPGPEVTVQQAEASHDYRSKAIHAHDSQSVFAVGSSGRVVRTRNGGASVDVLTIPGSPTNLTVTSQPGDNARWYAGGYNAGFFRTTNGQAATPTWTNLTGALTAAGWPAGIPVWDVAAAGASTLWVVGSTRWIAKSTDGGTSWTAFQHSDVTLGGLYSVAAVDTNTAFISGASGKFLRTTTGGGNSAAWTVDTFGGNWYYSIEANSASAAFAVGSEGSSAYWNGTTWTLRGPFNDIQGNVRAVAMDPSASNVLYLGTVDGEIMKSSDSGVTWSLLSHTGGREIESMSAGTSNDIFAIGMGRYLIGSTDAGANWTTHSIVADTESYMGIASSQTNGEVAVAVDSDGGIDRTTNGGDTWTPVRAPTGVALFDVEFLDDQYVLAVGAEGTILESVDAGANWTPLTSGSTERLLGVEHLSGTDALAVGMNGLVLRTQNGGSTWTPSTIAAGRLRDIAAATDQIAVAVGPQSLVMRTANGGATWNQITGGALPAIYSDLGAVTAVSDSVFYAWDYVGSDMWKSIDAGLTWSLVNIGTTISRGDAAVEGYAMIGRTDNGTQYTADDGATSVTSNPNVTKVLAVEAVDAYTYYVGGHIHFIHRYDASSIPNRTISDYNNGVADWDTAPTTSMFGVCLQAVSGLAVPDWTDDTFNTAGQCETLDTDPWIAVPAAMSKVAHTTGAGDAGTIDLVWGARPSEAQRPGEYTATMVVEVVAPNA